MGVPSLGCRVPVRSDGGDEGGEEKGKGPSPGLGTQFLRTGRATVRGGLPVAGAQVSTLDSLAWLQGDSGGPVLCREPDGHWVQAGIISFASSCAQEDTPVLLTSTAAHSSWLRARAQGAAFLSQNPGTPEISDEDSCVGMSEGRQEWDRWGQLGLAKGPRGADRSTVSQFQLRTENWDKAFTHCQGRIRWLLRALSALKRGTALLRAQRHTHLRPLCIRSLGKKRDLRSD